MPHGIRQSSIAPAAASQTFMPRLPARAAGSHSARDRPRSLSSWAAECGRASRARDRATAGRVLASRVEGNADEAAGRSGREITQQQPTVAEDLAGQTPRAQKPGEMGQKSRLFGPADRFDGGRRQRRRARADDQLMGGNARKE